MRVGNQFAASVRAVNSTIYQVGTSAEILYLVSGGFRDYSYVVVGAEYSQTIELRGLKEYVHP